MSRFDSSGAPSVEPRNKRTARVILARTLPDNSPMKISKSKFKLTFNGETLLTATDGRVTGEGRARGGVAGALERGEKRETDCPSAND